LNLKYFIIYLILYFNITASATINKIPFTEEEKNWMKENPMIKVAVMNYWNHDGDGNTIHTDYLKILNRYSDLNIVPVRYDSWKEGYADAISKDNNVIHGIMNLAWSKEREKKYFLYSQVYIFEPSYLIVRDDSDIYNLQNLRNKTLLSKEKSITDDIIKDLSLNINIKHIQSDTQMYKKLYTDKTIDGFIAYKKDEELIKKYNLRVAKTIYDKYSTSAIGIKKRYPLLQSIINKIYNIIPKDDLSNLQNKVYNERRPYKVKSIKENTILFSQKQKDYLQNKKEIRYCVDPHASPYEQIKDGKLEGISLDYKKIFEEKLKIPFILIPTDSWNNTLQFAKENRCDIASFAIMETEERLKFLNFTTPYITVPLVLSTKPDVTFIPDIKKLRNQTVAITKGYGYLKTIKKRYPNLKIIEVANIQEGLQKVANGEIFGFVSTLASVGYMFQTEFMGELKITGKFDETIHLSIGVNLKNKTLLEILEKIIASIDKSTHKNIFNKHIAIKYEKGVNYQNLWKFIAGFVIILFGNIYWNRRLSSLNDQLIKTQQDLIEERNKAQKSTKIKSEFLSNMSHEIRTPMNGIIGMTHLINQTEMTKEQHKYINIIQNSSTNLLNIINDILDFSKIESGKLTIEKINFDLIEMVNNVFDLVSFESDKKNLDLKLIYEDIPVELYGYSFRISQILINLINNAIKFTSSGYIHLEIKNNISNIYTFIITDSGIGMNKKQQSRLFQSFSQGDSSTTRKYGGTGLGLSISKQLVELMDGKIWCDSEEKKGSSFTFELPLEKSRTPIKQNTNTIKDLLSLHKTQHSNILLVEDNQINQEIIVGLLKDSNIIFDIASNGKEGLDLFQKNSSKYDLIFMDIQMPIMNGYEATKEIRILDQKIPIIALTANAMKEDIQKIKDVGINEHLNKPLEVEKLNNILQKYLS